MRALDVLFFIYFLTHIPIAVLVDFQGLIPDIYPPQLVAVREWYCTEFRDPMMSVAPVWFRSLLVCELFQFLFSFVGTYGFFKGAQKCKWLRLPCIIYGTHVATTLIPVIAHVMFNDFSKETLPGPRNLKERLTLLSVYSPYLFVPILLVLDALFSSAYRSSPPNQQHQQRQKKVK